MKKKISISDIARIAKVSKSTVSRYFNGGYVKEETKQKIAEIVELNNYVPNAFARLKANESKIIGIIAPCLDSAVTSEVLMAIDERLREQGYQSFIINTNHCVEEERRSMVVLSQMNVDGIILNATMVSEEHEQIAKSLDIPVVFVGQQFQEGVSIIYEDDQAGYKMGQFIGEQEFHDVVLVSVEEDDQAVGIDRKQGILKGLHEQGIKQIEVVSSDFSFAKSYEVIGEVLDRHVPEVLICSSSRQVIAAYQLLRKRKLQIPQDISVVGFGGKDIQDLLVPSLTSIRFDAREAGYLSVETLFAMQRGETVAKTQIIPYEFIIGESVKKAQKEKK